MSRIKGFNCIRCGDCCRKFEVIEKVLPCPKLDQERNLCTIYEDRPEACREYPHNVEWAVESECKGSWSKENDETDSI